jgi:dynactin complex subunit
MSVDDRVCFNSSIGTIKYVGPVSAKAGIWYGIEWDDPTRGKGDGSVDGVRYFTCK